MIQMDISGNECIHRVVVDYIDIDPDRSQEIVYCEKCFYTFVSKNKKNVEQLLDITQLNRTIPTVVSNFKS